MHAKFKGAHAEFTQLQSYPGVPISTPVHLLACNYFAITNKLSDSATKQLLTLIRIHCPDATQSKYKLKKQHNFSNDFEMYRFCFQCMKKLDNVQLFSEKTCKTNKADELSCCTPIYKHLCIFLQVSSS